MASLVKRLVYSMGFRPSAGSFWYSPTLALECEANTVYLWEDEHGHRVVDFSKRADSLERTYMNAYGHLPSVLMSSVLRQGRPNSIFRRKDE